MTETADEIVEAAEHRAAFGAGPQTIADGIIAALKERRDGETALDRSVLDKLDARIGEMDAQAAERDHPKLKKGAEQLRKAVEIVRRMMDLTDEGAQAELTDLAQRIRVCICKSDNLANTAGQHLRKARDHCRAIGLDFNKWCAEANLGIKRSRIYQLMGPDPIAADRRNENNNEEPENVQSVDVAQLPNAERPVEPADEPDPACEDDKAARLPPYYEAWSTTVRVTAWELERLLNAEASAKLFFQDAKNAAIIRKLHDRLGQLLQTEEPTEELRSSQRAA
jgi:hypothetical protein